MTIEEATEEMNQAAAALALAQQHLLEATAEATQNLADIKKILGFETPAMKLAPAVEKLRLPKLATEKKPIGRAPSKSIEDYKAELEDLEKIQNPTKQETARKAQVRWILKKKGVEVSPAKNQDLPTVEIKNKPDLLEIANTEEAKQATEANYKVLVHEKGCWFIRKICPKAEAQAEMERLTLDGYEVRIKRIQE